MSSQDAHDRGQAGDRSEKMASDLDVGLIRELQTGAASERSQEQLFKRFYPQVYGAFRRRGFLPEDAEDLAQDTLLQAFDKIEGLRQPEQFRGWLFSISVNIFRNELRRRTRHKADTAAFSLDVVDHDEVPKITLSDGAPQPDFGLLEKERRQLLQNAIVELPPQMRQCVRLRFEQGLKYREIAAVLKISIDTVKAHLSQARKRLTDELRPELETGSPK